MAYEIEADGIFVHEIPSDGQPLLTGHGIVRASEGVAPSAYAVVTSSRRDSSVRSVHTVTSHQEGTLFWGPVDTYPDVLACLDALHYDTSKIKVLIHQFVTLVEAGKTVKMSTREGQFITLENLINETGPDVVRYFFIMRGMNSHLNFDMDTAKDQSDQNPVYYLQYAHARIANIIKHGESLGYTLNTSLII